MPEEQVVPAEEQEQVAASSTEDTTDATESGTEASNESQSEGEAKPKGGFQRRIDKLTQQKAEKEREAEFWRAEALRNKPVETTKEAPKAEGKPKEDDFSTHADYVEALTDWKVESRFKAVEAKQNEEKAKAYQQTAAQSYQAKEQEYKAAVPDFDEVIADADFPVSQAVFEEIATNESGPALKYFLAKNPEEAERLSKLTPMALAREVGRLESRFTTAPQKTAAKVTNAPPPPNIVGKSSVTSTKDPGEMTPSEYRVWRAKTYPGL